MNQQTKDQIAAVFIHLIASGQKLTEKQHTELAEYLKPVQRTQ